ncbi:hypothetical protein [Paenibacillus aestuarii]|uniref:Nucleotidyltransferase family protein n=1 Tax=Paenibacillus aestuarii TaxID=516965 RepID=A0ABW0K9J4_9BACL|nr:hypothetical protein [Paenibacillus aestuarii]
MVDKDKDLFQEFLKIAGNLNNELDIVPVLYGSLGLQMKSGIDFEPEDIDVLVPLKFLNEKWSNLREVVERMGYTFVDLREHEFHKSGIKLAFTFMEDLADFAGVDYRTLETMEMSGVKYHILQVDDFLKVYTRSLSDSYRRTKNNNKDANKIHIIEEMLNQ